ncbi:leucine-rich repeat domain-containing protein [Hyalangium rubrum]|uniref:Leucine-rich repeat domain-containing protein n=1 Tax=Hyalangium rubrum TaxID=3103134 RepID=A0ABU5H2Y8_9BACT|nr:leucine-rich repeat domain-containing protein [Hyalangium sp. s54d21]MDY7227142.1 leucine-rich repeat domain-containing protein [Hyalangium sp. s54d21]
MTVSQPPPIESVVTAFLQKGYVPAKGGKLRVEQALTLPLREQLVQLIASKEPANIAFVCGLLQRDDFPAPLSTSLRELLLEDGTAKRVAFECGHLELFEDYSRLRFDGYSKPALPGGLGRLAQLKDLSLIHGDLEAIPEEIGLLGELTVLYANFQRLQSVSPAIGRLGKLKALYLNNNQLTALPGSVAGLARLEKLHLDGNRFDHVPSGIWHMSSLRDLDLTGNQLTRIPDEIAQLSNLEHLRLGSNPIKAISPRIAELSRLERLSLNDESDFRLLPEELQARVKDKYVCEMDGYLEINLRAKHSPVPLGSK